MRDARLPVAVPLERSDPLMNHKWRTMLILSVAEFLGMSAWFSASAVVPTLTIVWDLDAAGRAWLTMAVQIGFVVGALGSALLNLADKVPGRYLFSLSAGMAALATVMIPVLDGGLALTLVLRFLTGLALAGVYPVGMKIMATWTLADRGLGIGLLTGAISLGSAAPHLIASIGGLEDWRFVLYGAAGLTLMGGVICALFVREGPYRAPAPRFNWRYATRVIRQPGVRLANLGYLGHMWELFAMLAWVPVFLLVSFDAVGIQPVYASIAAFGTIAVGALGSVLAGRLADQIGRTTVTILSLIISGVCALTVGLFFGGNPIWLVVICLVWGFWVVADSAQFSASVSELADKEYAGTALTLQTSLGFLLTLTTIWLVPVMEQWVGWRWAFTILALGPAVGVWAMFRLRHSPDALRLAGGKG